MSALTLALTRKPGFALARRTATTWPSSTLIPGLARMSPRRTIVSTVPVPDSNSSRKSRDAPTGPAPRRVAGQHKVPPRPSPKKPTSQDPLSPEPEPEPEHKVPPPNFISNVLRTVQSLWEKVFPPEVSNLTQSQSGRQAPVWDKKTPGEPPERLHPFFHPIYRLMFQAFVRMERTRFTLKQAFWLSIWISATGYFLGVWRGQNVGIANVALEYGLDPSGAKGVLAQESPKPDAAATWSDEDQQQQS